MRSAGFLALPLAALLSGAPPLLAQVPDPTRPPAQAMAAEPGAGAVAAPAAGVHAVIVRPHGKSGAVISGQYVETGGKLGDKRIIRITESEVVLKGEGGREIIKLIPAAEKMPVVKSAASSASKRRSMGKTEQ